MVSGADSEHSGEAVLFEGRRALVPSISVLLLAIVTLGLWLIPRWWHRSSKLYRVTTRRIVVETGVLSKRLEQIDLYRIADYTVDRPFGQRMLGTGNLLLKTLWQHGNQRAVNPDGSDPLTHIAGRPSALDSSLE